MLNNTNLPSNVQAFREPHPGTTQVDELHFRTTYPLSDEEYKLLMTFLIENRGTMMSGNGFAAHQLQHHFGDDGDATRRFMYLLTTLRGAKGQELFRVSHRHTLATVEFVSTVAIFDEVADRQPMFEVSEQSEAPTSNVENTQQLTGDMDELTGPGAESGAPDGGESGPDSPKPADDTTTPETGEDQGKAPETPSTDSTAPTGDAGSDAGTDAPAGDQKTDDTPAGDAGSDAVGDTGTDQQPDAAGDVAGQSAPATGTKKPGSKR